MIDNGHLRSNLDTEAGNSQPKIDERNSSALSDFFQMTRLPFDDFNKVNVQWLPYGVLCSHFSVIWLYLIVVFDLLPVILQTYTATLTYTFKNQGQGYKRVFKKTR